MENGTLQNDIVTQTTALSSLSCLQVKYHQVFPTKDESISHNKTWNIATKI